MMFSRLLFLGFAMLLSWSVQAQFPCFPGQISVAPGYEASFCDDGSGPILIRFKGKPAGLPHAFVVVDANDVIVHIDYANTIDFSGLGGGLRVYTFSLIGSITAQVGDILGETELASGCYSLSSNFIDIDSNGGQEGGMLAGGPFNFCVGDGVADMIEPGAITLTGNSGTNSAWVVTDDQGNILGLPPMPSAVDFDGAGVGTCLVWHLSFEDGLVGAEVGLNAADLDGCFDLSNPISVNRNQPDGGTLEGGPFTFCVGDGVADMLEPGAITLTGNTGTNSAWVVTDDQGNILGLPPMPSAVDFDGAGAGTCLVWHLSFEDGLVGAEVGLNAADLEGCFDLSNPISVNRNQPDGGTLEGGPFTFCVGDGVADMLEPGAITLTGNSGTNSAWVVTDDQGNILGLPPMPSAVDFDGAGAGTCLVWHLSFEDGLVGAEVGLNAADLEGCFDLSNPISVNRNQPDGGTLEGGPFTFCVGDGVADMLEPGAITLTGNSGTNSAWVVTDDQGNILGLPPMPSAVDFDGAGAGTCLVWHLSFEDGLVGAEVGLNAADLEGCFDLSNPISVNRNQPDGGTLEGGPFTFCVGDGVADMLEPGAITLTGNSGTNSAWVVTDDQGNILGLPPMPSAVDFDGAGVGTCLVWHLSFEDGLVGAEVGLNAADLEGCFDLSNPISVNRNQPDGGTLEGGPFTFCVGDGVADMLEPGAITLTGNSGTNSAWVVTDDQGNILGLPPMPSAVDFDGAGVGTCLVWHLSFEDGLVGAEVGLNAADLEGCFDLSNPISVNRNQPDGGTLEGGPFTFCVGDGVADMLEPGAITLTGNSGTNSAWVVTDDQGNILGLPPMPSAVDFDGAGAGTCLIWHLSFEDGLVGAEVGLNAADLEGCFDLSNPISVNRNQPDGGTLEGGPFTFCVGDGVADMLEPGAITLTGNSGTNSAWVVTDDQGNILGLPPMPSAVDFDGAGAGTCLVWHLSFEDGLVGAEVGLNAADLEGCFDLSNPISVNRNQPDGGTLEGGVYEFCVGDGVADMLEPGSITLTGNSGANSAWVVTDDQGNILGLPPMPSAVDFDDAGAGTCLVWHLSFEDGLVGAEVGLNAADLEGCFDLSNPITINRVEGADCDNLCNSNGGFLTGGPFTFCVGDDIVDNLPEDAITLTGNSGTNSAWVVTDEQGNILGLPPTPSAVDFDGAGAGTCLVWHLSFEDGLVGAEVGLNATDLEGCFDLSNPISVNRNQPEGGTLEGGPFTFCVGDGVADMLEPGSITLTGNSGTNSAWVVTDDQGNILGLPPMPSAVDFDGAGAGTCLVWHLSFEDGLVGAEVGLNAADLQGCFSLSNPITVNRNQPDGGMLEGGPFSFCVSDGVADMIEEGAITLIGNSGGNSAWVVTDDQGNILGLPPTPSAVDFDGAGEGTCLVWHLSFEDGLTGAEVGMNAADLQGCFSLSNPISVERTAVNGGMVSTIDGETNVTVTVGDGEADIIQFANTAAVGENFTYVITDENNIILGLPTGDSADFEDAPTGICRVWGLAYTGNIIAVVGDNAAEVTLSDGCFNLSDIFITVNRTEGFAPNIPQSNAVTEGPAILEIQLFPNPAVDQLQVALTTNSVSNENIELTIVDLNGQVLYQRIISADQVRTTVDVANLPAGTYFLRSNDGKQVITKRFIKA